jgi:hypothetical protein
MALTYPRVHNSKIYFNVHLTNTTFYMMEWRFLYFISLIDVHGIFLMVTAMKIDIPVQILIDCQMHISLSTSVCNCVSMIFHVSILLLIVLPTHHPRIRFGDIIYLFYLSVFLPMKKVWPRRYLLHLRNTAWLCILQQEHSTHINMFELCQNFLMFSIRV